MTEQILEKEVIQNRVSQALMWLGFEDVEFEKRFSTDKFEKGSTGEDVYETNIAYSNKDNLLPNKAADHIIKLLENVIDYHLRKNSLQENKAKLEAQFQKESENVVDNN